MTRIQFSLPDELAKAASQAGLLAPEAMQAMLREMLKAKGMISLKKAWTRSGDIELSEPDEAMITDAIRHARRTQTVG